MQRKCVLSEGKNFRDYWKTEYATKYLRNLEGLHREEHSFEYKGCRGEISFRKVYAGRHLITYIALWVSPVFALKVNENVQRTWAKKSYSNVTEIKIK